MSFVIGSFPRKITRAHGVTQVSSIGSSYLTPQVLLLCYLGYALRRNLLAINDASKRYNKKRHDVKKSRERIHTIPAEEADLWHKTIRIGYSWNVVLRKGGSRKIIMGQGERICPLLRGFSIDCFSHDS